jgi:uncharacterized protein YerC
MISVHNKTVSQKFIYDLQYVSQIMSLFQRSKVVYLAKHANLD